VHRPDPVADVEPAGQWKPDLHGKLPNELKPDGQYEPEYINIKVSLSIRWRYFSIVQPEVMKFEVIGMQFWMKSLPRFQNDFKPNLESTRG
jgi:hypothetical protein